MSAGRGLADRQLLGRSETVRLADLAAASSLQGRLEELRGRTVVVLTADQLAFAVLMIELDGVARRVVACPPDLSAKFIPSIIRDANADVWIGDPGQLVPAGCTAVTLGSLASVPVERRSTEHTEWVLLTSGTTGSPKLVVHTMEGLMSAFITRDPPPPGTVWSTFYDIRRYGGLQVCLRGLCSASLVLSVAGEPVGDFLTRAAADGVTHISGTPSHWRKVLMSGAASRLSPQYIRLSGEIADQGILDALARAFPAARIAHAFASTEAGVGFEVSDGRSGFPVHLIESHDLPAEIRVSEGLLRLRSVGNARCYLGAGAPSLKSVDGFVDTGDRVERRGDRIHFVGRSDWVINVGGQKVYPEEIESVINGVSGVHISRVRGRKNPISGAVVMADVVRRSGGRRIHGLADDEELKRLIYDACRRTLAPHKVPATIKIVTHLQVAPSGKMVRDDA